MGRITKLVALLALCCISLTCSVAFKCPSDDQNDPAYPDCHCTPTAVVCFRNSTEKAFEKLLTDLFTLNNPTADPTILIEVPAFQILSTDISSLNLTPLLGFNFSSVVIHDNYKLAEITGPTPSANVQNYSLVVKELSFNNNNLTALSLDGFFQTVKGLEKIEMHNNRLKPEQFLIPFSNLEDIQVLNMQTNDLRFIPRGFLSSAKRLRHVGLDANLLVGLAEGALELSNLQEETGPLTISLSYNGLIDPSFVNSGLDRLHRVTHLNLNYNKFYVLLDREFEGFLQAHQDNSISLEHNDFCCDWRMQWLQDGRAEYEHRVTGVVCKNDPIRRTIFNTTINLDDAFCFRV